MLTSMLSSKRPPRTQGRVVLISQNFAQLALLVQAAHEVKCSSRTVLVIFNMESGEILVIFTLLHTVELIVALDKLMSTLSSVTHFRHLHF